MEKIISSVLIAASIFITSCSSQPYPPNNLQATTSNNSINLPLDTNIPFTGEMHLAFQLPQNAQINIYLLDKKNAPQNVRFFNYTAIIHLDDQNCDQGHLVRISQRAQDKAEYSHYYEKPALWGKRQKLDIRWLPPTQELQVSLNGESYAFKPNRVIRYIRLTSTSANFTAQQE